MELPSLNALRAFEAAARHQSFVKAGEELHVSPGAISRHVKLLEEELGLRLFDRKAQGLALTEVGERLLPEISAAFGRIATATARLRGSGSELRVIVAPTLATRWLIPNLASFHAQHPHPRISIGIFTQRFEQYFEGNYDVGIIQGWWLRPDAQVETRVLRHERLIAVCAPDVARRTPRLRRPQDLKNRTLLHVDDDRDWRAWLEAAGAAGIESSTGIIYDTMDMALRAAIAGKGVAIVDSMLVRYELDSGQVVSPFDFVLDDASPLVLFASPGRLDEPHVQHFASWLKSALDREAPN